MSALDSTQSKVKRGCEPKACLKTEEEKMKDLDSVSGSIYRVLLKQGKSNKWRKDTEMLQETEYKG